jgi:hypothetical protein
MTRCGEFGGRKQDGTLCRQFVVAGTRRCKNHSGKPKAQAKAEGAVVLELQKWGLDTQGTLRDAGEVLLRLVTQSAARVEMYSRMLGEAFQAAEHLREASDLHGLADDPLLDEGESPEVQAARADLRRIFAQGGVGALIGSKYGVDSKGRVFAAEEAIRGLALLEAQERDRCANFAAKAVAAGLAERQVRLAESQGAVMYGVFSRVLAALGLSGEQAGLVPGLLEREIRALTQPAIEGKVVK